jgi:hypothetical protein
MNDACRNKWMLVAVLWVGSVSLALWNLSVMDRLALAAGTHETLAANRQFIASRQDEFAGITRRVVTLVRPVEAPAYGLLYLEQDLAALAAECGLGEFKLEGEPARGASGAQPVTVSFSGKLGAATRWLAAAQERLRHVTVVRLEAKSSPEKVAATFTVSLVYRYQVVSPQG